MNHANQNGPIQTSYILGDNWWDQTFQLDINVTLEDGGNPEGTNLDVDGINCLYDSLNYFLQTGSDGITLFDSVMRGTYDITVSKTGYQVTQINDFYLWQDSTINIELAIDSSAIQNFSIDPLTSIATWDLATDSPGERDAEYFKIFLDGVLSDSIGMDERSYFYRCLQFGQEYDAGISAVFQWGESDTSEVSFTSSYLVPPAKPVTVYEEGWDEVAFWLHIHQTCDTMDFPEGLMSFNLYRDGMFFGTVPWDPNPGDSIPIVDNDLDPGTYIYCVTAKYNLAPYGYPGQTAESAKSCDTVTVNYGFELPFIEDWNSGNFDYNDWRLQSSGNNWVVTSQDGNPAPSAQFNWEPTEENYSNTLTTTPLDASTMTEGKIWLDFQVKLDDFTASGTEKFTIRLSNLDQTYNLYQFKNEGSFDWDTIHLDITPFAMGNNFQIIFDANGENNSNIDSWYIDNIEIYRECPPPCPLSLAIDTVGYDEYDLSLNWECDYPPVISEWIHWDDGNNEMAVGMGSNMVEAIKWDAGQFSQYDSFNILKAKTFINSIGFDTLILHIWEGPQPLTPIYTDTIDIFNYNYWNIIDLKDTLIWDSSKEYWVGFEYLNISPGSLPAGVDGGPAESGYGDLIKVDDGNWQRLSDLGYDHNWNMALFLSSPDTGLVSKKIRISSSDMRGFSGNNIYRSTNGGEFTLIDFVPYVEGQTQYDYGDGIPADGNSYCFQVTNVWESETDYCESAPALSATNPDENFVCATLVGEKENSTDKNNLIKIFSNPANSRLTIQSTVVIREVSLVNLVGQTVISIKTSKEQNKQVDLNTIGLKDGIYIIKIRTKKGTINRKVLIHN